MKIILTQPGIEQILRAHVLNTITLKDGSQPSINFTATRSADGITAEIDIPYIGVNALDLGTSNTDAQKAPEPAAAKTDVKPAPTSGRGKNASTKADKSNLFAGLTGGTSAPAAPADTTSAAAENTTAAASDSAGETGGEEAGATAGSEESGEAGDEAAEGAAPPTTGGKSLFDN